MNKDKNYTLPDLVDNLSHELRTPLSAILGYSELLKKSKNLNKSERSHLAKISNNGRQLLDIINDIIEISSIESGNIAVKQHTISTSSLADGMREKFETMAKAKGLSFRVVLEKSEDIKFITDEKKLKTIIYSLINNAIKFTEFGSVEVHLSMDRNNEDEATLDVSVHDTGRGVKKEELPHIFKPFWQSASDSKKGTGLGLAICKKLVTMLEGKMDVKSEVDAGTQVSIAIPVNIDIGESDAEAVHSNPQKMVENAKDLKALIVDDLPINRTLARIMLEMKKFEVIEAENGEQALNYYATYKPDVVLMDISMPVMDGIEAMKKIRQENEGDEQIPIIAVTAGGHTGTRSDMIEKGFSEYIQKPYKEEELFEKISLFLPVPKSKKSIKSVSFQV